MSRDKQGRRGSPWPTRHADEVAEKIVQELTLAGRGHARTDRSGRSHECERGTLKRALQALGDDEGDVVGRGRALGEIEDALIDGFDDRLRRFIF